LVKFLFTLLFPLHGSFIAVYSYFRGVAEQKSLRSPGSNNQISHWRKAGVCNHVALSGQITRLFHSCMCQALWVSQLAGQPRKISNSI